MNDIPMDIQRGAFLTLVKNNVHGIATALLHLLAFNADALTQQWHSFGGDIAGLKMAVLQGSQKNISGAGDVDLNQIQKDVDAARASQASILTMLIKANPTWQGTPDLQAQVDQLNSLQPKPPANITSAVTASLNNILQTASLASTNTPITTTPDNSYYSSSYVAPLDTVNQQLQPTQGGGTAIGFIFKTLLLINMKASPFFISNPKISGIVGAIVIAVAIAYVGYKKLKSLWLI